MAAYRRVDDLTVTCRLTACTPGSAPGPMLGIEYGKPLPFFSITQGVMGYRDSLLFGADVKWTSIICTWFSINGIGHTHCPDVAWCRKLWGTIGLVLLFLQTICPSCQPAVETTLQRVLQFGTEVSCCVCSYYPLYPPHPDVPVDMQHFFVHCQLPVAPHLMILPSDLRCFIKVRPALLIAVFQCYVYFSHLWPSTTKPVLSRKYDLLATGLRRSVGVKLSILSYNCYDEIQPFYCTKFATSPELDA